MYLEQAKWRSGSFGCAHNKDHYDLHVATDVAKITMEAVHIYEEFCQYEIAKQCRNNITQTQIVVRETDAEQRVLIAPYTKMLTLGFDAFDFRNFDQKKVIERIKTLFVFQ